jgi:hypothetical protein
MRQHWQVANLALARVPAVHLHTGGAGCGGVVGGRLALSNTHAGCGNAYSTVTSTEDRPSSSATDFLVTGEARLQSTRATAKEEGGREGVHTTMCPAAPATAVVRSVTAPNIDGGVGETAAGGGTNTAVCSERGVGVRAA